MSTNPCITIDVSQDRSHIQGFISLDEPICKAHMFVHNLAGYQNILDLFNQIKSKTGEDPLIIFEYTGIYHKTIERFLNLNNLPYHIVSPVRAAKSRQKEMRSVKTDKRDCLSIAKMFYNNNLGDFNNDDIYFNQLRNLSRSYETIQTRLQEYKVNFRETLSVVYPNYEIRKITNFGAFKSVYTDESFNFLLKYPHPELFCNITKDDFLNFYEEISSRVHLNYGESIYNRLHYYCSNIISGCSVDSNLVYMIKFYVTEITRLSNELDKIIKQMVIIAKNTSYFDLIKTIPCIKDNLAVRLVAEIGNINKFKSYKALIAIAGTDPRVDGSGDKTGEHKKITKQGNRYLRKILYLMVCQMVKAKNIDSPIKEFYKRKTQQGLPKLVASVACCNKLLRIIYYMNKTGSAFTEH